MTTTQYLRVFARFWLLVALFAVAGLVVGVLIGAPASGQTRYLSTTSVLVSGTAAAQSGAADASQTTLLAQQRMSTYADVAAGPTLAEDILAEGDVGLDASQLQERIEVVVPDGSTVLRITVTDTDSDRARRLASLAGASMVHVIDDLEEVKGRNYALLRARVVVDATPATTVPAAAAAPAWRNPALGAAGGLVLGLALAVAASRLDPRLGDESSVREALGAPVLGVLPSPGRRGSHGAAGATDWEAAVRELRTSIFFQHPGSGHCLVLALISPRPDDRVRAIAPAIATALVDTGARVLLVDADLREAHATPLLGGSAGDEPGLAAHLVGAIVEHDLVVHDAQSGVEVLPAGAPLPNPAGLLHSEAFADLLKDASQRFDFVLVAAPATSLGTDAIAVAARCDVSLVTVVRHRTTYAQVTRARRQLELVDAAVAGAVLLT